MVALENEMKTSSLVNTSVGALAAFTPAAAPALAAQSVAAPFPEAAFPAASAAVDPAAEATFPRAAFPRASAPVDPAPTAAVPAVPPQEAAQAAVPSFITPASLASVSGGTAAVTLLWTVAKALFGKTAEMPLIPFVCALAVGAAIYWLSVADKKVKMSAREKVIGTFIAFLNSMVLFSASLGIHGR